MLDVISIFGPTTSMLKIYKHFLTKLTAKMGDMLEVISIFGPTTSMLKIYKHFLTKLTAKMGDMSLVF